jgi:hypothetical protein
MRAQILILGNHGAVFQCQSGAGIIEAVQLRG